MEATGPLGALAVSQWGGPGNISGDAGTADESFVDVSAWNVTNPELDLLPEVTDWTTVEDLSQSRGRVVGGFGVTGMEAAPGDSGGAMIQGTGPAGRTLEVGIGAQNSGEVIEVVIDGDGNWSFPAPSTPGTYTVSLTATDGGFNRSETVDYSIEVVVGAPAITSPADGSSVVDEVTAISGTGVPGALVTLGGDAEGEATVGDDGTWTVNIDLGIGAHTVTAVQEVDGEVSPEVTSTFAVIPPAPVVTSPEHGVDYTKAPTAARGTGVDGAQIVVYLNGEHVGTTTVADGEWSVDLPGGLAAGDYDLRVTQTVNGQTNTTDVRFGVLVAAAASSPKGDLPATGAGVLLPLVLGGVALTAAGTAVAVRRRGRDEAPIA